MVFFMTAFAIVEALQLLIMVAHVYSFIPIHWNVPMPKGLEPERESFLYFIFCCAVLAFMGAAIRLMRKPFADPAQYRTWRNFVWMECLWVFLLLFAFFKWLTYTYPFYNVLPLENGGWVRPFFYVVLFLSVLSKIFWPEINRWGNKAHRIWLAFQPSPVHTGLAYAATGAFIAGLLWPNADEVLRLVSTMTQFRQWQDFPLTRWLLQGQVRHVDILWALYVVHVAGWWALFWLVHRWLKSFWLAALAVWLGIKISMFHYGLAPVCWAWPGSSWLLQGVGWLPQQGWGSVPMYEALRVRQFFSFFMGYTMPVFYMFTLFWAWGKSRVAVGIAAYGLLIYTKYIWSPTMFAYGAVAIPAVVLGCFWLAHLKHPSRKMIFAALALAALFALTTNRLYVSYP